MKTEINGVTFRLHEYEENRNNLGRSVYTIVIDAGVLGTMSRGLGDDRIKSYEFYNAVIGDFLTAHMFNDEITTDLLRATMYEVR